MKLRFSLRALLVLVGALAAFGYLRSRPAAIARQFELAVSAQEYSEADSLINDSRDRFLQDLKKNGCVFEVTVRFEPQTAANWLRGRCHGYYSAYSGNCSTCQQGKVEASSVGIRICESREYPIGFDNVNR